MQKKKPRGKPFEEGHEKLGGIQKGDKHDATIVKELLSDRISDFDEKLYDIADNLLNDPMSRGFAWKELLKYRLPQKRELSGETTHNFNLNFKY